MEVDFNFHKEQINKLFGESLCCGINNAEQIGKLVYCGKEAIYPKRIYNVYLEKQVNVKLCEIHKHINSI
jgi:hypothetical protein